MPAGCSAAAVVLVEVARQVAHAVPDRVVLHELALAGQYALEHLVLGGHLVEHLIGDLLQLAQYRLGQHLGLHALLLVVTQRGRLSPLAFGEALSVADSQPISMSARLSGFSLSQTSLFTSRCEVVSVWCQPGMM